MKNKYSDFITLNEIQKELTKINSKEPINKSGIPFGYDNNALYIDDDYGHNLVIGSTGCGKTQAIILPKCWLSIKAGENLIVDDIRGENYEQLESDLKDNNYKVIKIDYRDYNNGWNPLKLVYDLYKKGNTDDAIMLLEKVSYYLFSEALINNTSDPFWMNSTKQLFIGITLYIMENEDVIPTIKYIYDYASKINKESYRNLKEDSLAKIFLKVTMEAPEETCGSIFSVFNSSIMSYAYSNKLSEFLANNDYDFNDLLQDRVAIFIIDGHKNIGISSLILLFIEELKFIFDKNDNKNRTNILLDQFNDFVAIDNFAKLLLESRSLNMEYTLEVESLHKLGDTYGEVALEYILGYFTRIIYLYAKDAFTLNYVANMCGNKNDKEKLITDLELKLLKVFDAIILKTRELPLKTKLLPFYKFDR